MTEDNTENFEAIIEEGFEPREKDIDEKQFDITVYLKGTTFVSFDAKAGKWGYTPDGVFIDNDTPGKPDQLIPYESVLYYDLYLEPKESG